VLLTIERVRQHFVEEGIQRALSPRKTRRKYQHLMDGVQEAHLPGLWHVVNRPKGHRRWSLAFVGERDDTA